MFKKIAIVSLVLVSQLFGIQSVELLGDKAYPPYSYVEDGVAKGIYVDIIQKATDKIPEYEVNFRMTSWNRAMALVKKGKSIGFFPPYYSKERMVWTKFSEPILAERSRVFALPKTLKGRTDFPKDFLGMTVCLNKGFSLMLGGAEMKEAIDNGTLKIVYGKNNRACLGRVFRGLADFYVNDQLIDISEFPEIKRGLNATENFGHIGFTLKTKEYPYLVDFEKKFNRVIVEMKESGEIEKILKDYKGK